MLHLNYWMPALSPPPPPQTDFSRTLIITERHYINVNYSIPSTHVLNEMVQLSFHWNVSLSWPSKAGQSQKLTYIRGQTPMEVITVQSLKVLVYLTGIPPVLQFWQVRKCVSYVLPEWLKLFVDPKKLTEAATLSYSRWSERQSFVKISLETVCDCWNLPLNKTNCQCSKCVSLPDSSS